MCVRAYVFLCGACVCACTRACAWRVHACGSEAMIRSSQVKAEANGLSEKNFFSDAFVVSGKEQD